MTDIDVLLQEHRKFEPPEAFRRAANVSDPEIYARAAKDYEAFWAQCARELEWSTPFTKVLEWKPPWAKWFSDGELNACVNCVDRHARGARRDKPAIIWEGEPGDTRTLTYSELLREVSKFASVLDSLGVKKGDRVAIYLPMIPEAAIAMLGCARIGAVHSVVFGGFSAESLRDRIVDAQARVLVTADIGFRRGGAVPLKKNADDAISATPTIEHVIVVRRTEDAKHAGQPVEMRAKRDQWWHDLMAKAKPDRPATAMNAEDVLFTLYTSGTTGKPKGIVHTTGGYLTQCAVTTKLIFDLKEDDIFWCTADVGWVTGHSYIVYGPLANGATCLMYEGAPDWPEKDRFWALCEKYGVTIFYTAPTAIRAFMKWGSQHAEKHDLSKLRLLGTVGEPINPEAWLWYHRVVGEDRCPIVDTWWQSETGATLMTPL
ncbi:MAG: acetate--CoA ligase, partial [Gemmatimonadales bacterium]